MATTVVLTIIAFALIFVENGGYKPVSNPINCVLLLSINYLFRCLFENFHY